MSKYKQLSRNKKYYQLIPLKIIDNIDVIANTIRPRIKGFNLDCLKETISIVARHTEKSGKPARLKKQYVINLVPQGREYLDGLIRAGVLKRSGRYIVGKQCYQYEFSDEYKSIYVRELLLNNKLIYRIRRAWDKLREERKAAVRGGNEQVPWLLKLTIDPGWKTLLTGDADWDNHILAAATQIENGEIRYSVDTTSFRFHSNVTNMSKKMREYIRIDNKQLLNIDVSNSQPYLSTILLTDPKKASFLGDPSLNMLLSKMQVSKSKDVKRYVSLVSRGQFYEFMQTRFKINGVDMSRDEAKKQCFRLLFGSKWARTEIEKQTRDIFRKAFPNVYRIFNQVKGKNYERFPILLQRIESYLMLEKVVKTVHEQHPDIICITIHDSVMTGVMTDEIFAVQKILKNEFRKFTGITPKLTYEFKLDKYRSYKKLLDYNTYDGTTSVIN